ncbi:hypothetical protein NVP1170O_120 [Vibrio phage 1.170.O._10N.261.52.C3]|nr:hypothetical protein NVP1170O_120 [Vibrio phage 1.170.O._10N.261.52.C3]
MTKKYRIEAVTDVGGLTLYYPQFRKEPRSIFGAKACWEYFYTWEDGFDPMDVGYQAKESFENLSEAEAFLDKKITKNNKPKVEYIDYPKLTPPGAE